ncbi:DUF6686 family protein [Flectobacillus major]|jgi:hypothetical protein|uniref:DUF6686 family protein n=1 Tax=Flectobacillus major TaxID=103 RepID=UPI000428E6D0|nr:DUF6686 family protein [Flectobacillus major]
MYHSHDLVSIIERDTGYIGYCEACQKYNFAYKNALFIFSEDEFRAFRQLLVERIGLYEFYTSHGKELFLKTPLPNYFILFAENEIEEMLEMITETTLILDARRIVNS